MIRINFCGRGTRLRVIVVDDVYENLVHVF